MSARNSASSGGKRRQHQLRAAAALSLRLQFQVDGDVLARVEVFKYLGHLLSMEDDDAQAVRLQLAKAPATWARVGKVLRAENASPRVAGYFYKAVVQSVLLFGSESWNLGPALLARLEGFHIRCSYRMSRRHRPRRGPGGSWHYPASSDVLDECGLLTVGEYIRRRRQTIAEYVADRPLLAACRGGERRRGTPHRQWWWEQEMSLDSEPSAWAAENDDGVSLGSSASVGGEAGG